MTSTLIIAMPLRDMAWAICAFAWLVCSVLAWRYVAGIASTWRSRLGWAAAGPLSLLLLWIVSKIGVVQ